MQHSIIIKTLSTIGSALLASLPGPAQLFVACTESWAGPGNEANKSLADLRIQTLCFEPSRVAQTGNKTGSSIEVKVHQWSCLWQAAHHGVGSVARGDWKGCFAACFASRGLFTFPWKVCRYFGHSASSHLSVSHVIQQKGKRLGKRYARLKISWGWRLVSQARPNRAPS